MAVRAMRWEEGALWLLDQRLLPHEERWLRLASWQAVAEAIGDMAVRGAPAIGIAAAYGMALAAREGADLGEAYRGLLATRPTAVNLRWALDRVAALGQPDPDTVLAEASDIESEDFEANRRIGEHGAALISPGSCVLTICNTGALATGGHGTALGVIRTAFEQGRVRRVVVCETRPRLQGLRLTAWELLQDGIPFDVIADGAAASLLRAGSLDFVVTGADRIAANGDAANKIGTYTLALAANRHSVAFAVAAPTSTIDPSTASGAQIVIEERSGDEIAVIEGVRVAPEGCSFINPAFDVTPAGLIDFIVTELGAHSRPYDFRKIRPGVLNLVKGPNQV